MSHLLPPLSVDWIVSNVKYFSVRSLRPSRKVILLMTSFSSWHSSQTAKKILFRQVDHDRNYVNSVKLKGQHDHSTPKSKTDPGSPNMNSTCLNKKNSRTDQTEPIPGKQHLCLQRLISILALSSSSPAFQVNPPASVPSFKSSTPIVMNDGKRIIIYCVTSGCHQSSCRI